jgi:hypothetical protein
LETQLSPPYPELHEAQVMVAPRIHCIVVEIPVGSEEMGIAGLEHRMRSSVRDLLPEADPYIAALIRRLQDEVRQERAAAKPAPVNRLRMLRPTATNIPGEDLDNDEQDWPLLRDML